MTLLSLVQKTFLSLAFQTPTWRSQCCCFELHGKHHRTWSFRNHQCLGEQKAFFYHDFIQLVIEDISQVSKKKQKLKSKMSSSDYIMTSRSIKKKTWQLKWQSYLSHQKNFRYYFFLFYINSNGNLALYTYIIYNVYIVHIYVIKCYLIMLKLG